MNVDQVSDVESQLVKITSRDFQNICRICLVGENLQPLLEETDLVKMYSMISEIEFSENDQLPKNVCVSCFNSLLQITKFAEKCKAHHALLKFVLESQEQELEVKSINSELDGGVNDNDNDAKSESEYNDPSDDPSDDPTYEHKQNNVLDDNKPTKTKQAPRKLRTLCRRPKKVLSDDEKEKSDSQILACKACGNTFVTEAQLSCHYKDNKSCRPRNFKLFKCNNCEKEFSTKQTRKEHMNTHTGHICPYCGKTFQAYSNYFRHVYRHRVDLGEVEPKLCYMETRVRLNLKCDLCPKVFSSRSGFADHKLRHRGVKIPKRQTKPKPKEDDKEPKVKKFLCDHCPKSFVRMTHLKRHIRGHSGEKLFNCAICQKGFTEKVALVAHVENHLGTHRFKCETCKKPFSFKSQYELHKRTHTDENPLKCNICGKCFSYRDSLRIHMRMHTGETHDCQVCGNRYYAKKNLNRHQKIMGHLDEAIVKKINE